MRHVLTALLSAGAICAFASGTPAAAQTYGGWPFGAGSTSAGFSPTIASHTGAPTYSWHDQGPWLAPGGCVCRHCVNLRKQRRTAHLSARPGEALSPSSSI